MSPRLLMIGITLLLPASTAAATDLLHVLREAKNYDAQYASARAALDAGREKLPQGKALLLPSISGAANTTWNENEITFRGGATPGPFLRQFNSNGMSITLTQPLFRKQNVFQYEQAARQVAQAETQYLLAGQDLIVRVSQAYFDVLAAQDSIAFIRAQKTAIAEQLAQAKRNFEVGTATITDTHEAQSRFDLSISQEIAAESDLELKRRVLQQMIGKFPAELAPLGSSLQISPPQPNDMNQWVESAQAQNLSVRAQEAAADIAALEVERARAGHYPTVDAVGQIGLSSSGNNQLSGVGNDQRFSNIGVQLAIPLYAGGSIDSRVREALANRDRARADLENSRRVAALSTRQSFIGVTNGMAQIRALEQALISSETALASNRLGYEVGVRINIDVLNSQQQVFSTRRDLSRARYDTIVSGLKLKAAVGTLVEADIDEVNRLLAQ